MERELQGQNIDKNTLELIGRITVYSFLGIVLVMAVIVVVSKNRGYCLYSLWQNITFMQLIRWFALIGIDNSSEFASFFSQISLMFKPFTLPDVCRDVSIDIPNYNNMNIYSHSFINNSKEMLIIYFSVLVFIIGIIISNRLSRGAYFKVLVKKVKYSAVIRLHIVLFLDFTTYSIINIKYLNRGSSCSIANMACSIVFLAIGAFWIIRIPVYIKRKLSESLDVHPDIIFQSAATIFQEFKPNFKIQTYQYFTLFLLNRLSISFSLIILIYSPSVQLFVIAIFQLIFIVYICKVKPFVFYYDNVCVLASESLGLLLVVFMGIRTVSLGPNSKTAITIICVVLIWLIEISIIIRFILMILQKASPQIKTESLDETSSQANVDHAPNNTILGQTENHHNKSDSFISDLFLKSNNNSRRDVIVDIEPSKSSRLAANSINNTDSKKKIDLNKITVKNTVSRNESRVSSLPPIERRVSLFNTPSTTLENTSKPQKKFDFHLKNIDETPEDH